MSAENTREYVVYGAPISLFTRKLEAALRFYEAPFRSVAKGEEQREEIEGRARTHQVPVLQTPDDWMIADTTPILELLDARYPARRLFPPGPLGVLVHILEDVLDEWVARVMVHFRWHYDENTRFIVSGVLGREVSTEEARTLPFPKWGLRACRATGTESEAAQAAAEREYFGILEALEAQLAESAFALGDRPSAVDAMLLGGLHAHTDGDPLPDLGAYSRVLAWSRGFADGARWDGGGEWAPFPDSTPFAAHLLEIARGPYASFVLGNAGALAAGEKAFTMDTYGEPVSYLARPYPEHARGLVRDRIGNTLDPAERNRVNDWLGAQGLAECFAL